MSRRPDQRADQRQVKEMRAEGHAAWDYWCDAYAELQRQAKEMGRGYGSSTLGSGGIAGAGDMTPTEREALKRVMDPAATAADVLALGTTAFATLRTLERKVRAALPAGDDERERDAQRKLGLLEVCSLCESPVAHDDVKRLDGLPYHKRSCFYRAWREGRRTG